MTIYCEVITDKGAKKGRMFYQKDFTEQDLINWVYRNCQGCSDIKITPGEEVRAIYADELNDISRIEVYTLENKETQDKE